ncbi:hypothetical protein DPMN_184083 [Dreissena polymorpha]|uniref:Uncharacterized protein n=1 Tax=Dreissena polymorpha TaxID=45954 RepID=A0A9D4DH70_DREPO|nr:hypothetical protein DPMN_184083 [Dreissena polymorpha]
MGYGGIRAYGYCGEGNTGVWDALTYGKHWRLGNTGLFGNTDVWEILVLRMGSDDNR